MCVCAFLQLYVYVCVFLSCYLSLCVCLSPSLCVYMCVCVCVCVCERERERERVAKPIFPIPMDTELKICILLGNEVLYFSSLICVDLTLFFFFWYIDLLFLLISVLSNTAKLMLYIVPS